MNRRKHCVRPVGVPRAPDGSTLGPSHGPSATCLLLTFGTVEYLSAVGRPMATRSASATRLLLSPMVATMSIHLKVSDTPAKHAQSPTPGSGSSAHNQTEEVTALASCPATNSSSMAPAGRSHGSGASRSVGRRRPPSPPCCYAVGFWPADHG